MTTPFPYLNEAEACRLLHLTPGSGSAWRHLRAHAAHIKLVNVGGQTAVKRADLEAWLRKGRTAVCQPTELALWQRRQKLRRAIGQIKLKQAANGR